MTLAKPLAGGLPMGAVLLQRAHRRGHASRAITRRRSAAAHW